MNIWQLTNELASILFHLKLGRLISFLTPEQHRFILKYMNQFTLMATYDEFLRINHITIID
jgi:hypothetical protein